MLIEKKHPTLIIWNGIFIIITASHLLCLTLKVWKVTLFVYFSSVTHRYTKDLAELCIFIYLLQKLFLKKSLFQVKLNMHYFTQLHDFSLKQWKAICGKKVVKNLVSLKFAL